MNDSTSNVVTLSFAALDDRALVRCSRCARVSTFSDFARSCGCFSDNYPIEVKGSADMLANKHEPTTR